MIPSDSNNCAVVAVAEAFALSHDEADRLFVAAGRRRHAGVSIETVILVVQALCRQLGLRDAVYGIEGKGLPPAALASRFPSGRYLVFFPGPGPTAARRRSWWPMARTTWRR